MTDKEYKKAMKEAKAEFEQWIKDERKARRMVKKMANDIRMKNLKARG